MNKINNLIDMKLLSLFAGLVVCAVFAYVAIPGSANAQILQPVADIKANGNDGVLSVSYGASVNITWTSSNASSCWVEGVGWTGISGSQSTVSLTYSRTYNLGCTGPGGAAYDSVSVKVGEQSTPSFSQGFLSSHPSGQTTYISGAGSPSFSAGCAVSPTTAEVGQNVFIAGSSANGINPITYRWGGTVSGGGPTLTTSFSSTGTKIISVVATDSQGKIADASCSVNVVPVSPKIVSAPAPAPSLTPAPAPSLKSVVTTAAKKETDSASSPQADYDKICREMGYVKVDEAVDLAENSGDGGESDGSEDGNGEAAKKRSLLASIFFTDSGYPSWLFFTILVLTILFVLTLAKLTNGRKKQELPQGQIKK